MTETGKTDLKRAERRALNKAESARRFADRPPWTPKRTRASTSITAGHASGAGAREAVGGKAVVVLPDHGLSATTKSPSGPHQPTDEKRQAVVIMRANGFTKESVAAVLGIDDSDLDTHYAVEIENGFAMVAAKIASAVTVSALNGDQKDQHFWLRSRLKWGGGGEIVIKAGVLETGPDPNANKPFRQSGFGDLSSLPMGANGRLEIRMRLGIPDAPGEDGDDADG